MIHSSVLARLKNFPFSISAILSLLVAALGFTVILGWYFQNALLVQLHPAFVPMQFNTALGFLLSGTGMLLALRRRSWSAMVLGVLVGVIGGLTLFEYIGKVNLGIDQLFMEHSITTQTSHPGRMAPNTALCFLLSGIVLATVNANARFIWITLLGSAILGLGGIAFFGYATGIETAYGWGQLTQMALHTSLGFMSLGSAIAAWGRHYGIQREQNRFWYSFCLLAVALLVLVIALWQALKNQEDERIHQLIRRQLVQLGTAFEISLDAELQALMRMGNRWVFRAGLPREEWELDAQALLDDFQVFQSIAWFDADSADFWYLPPGLTGNAKETVFREVEEKIGKRVMVSSSFSLPKEGFGFFLIHPLYHPGPEPWMQPKMEGFLVVTVGIEALVKELIQTARLDNGLDLKIMQAGIPIMGAKTGQSLFVAQADWIRDKLDWRIELVPTPQYLSKLRSTLPILVFYAGVWGAGTLMLVFFLYHRVHMNALELRGEIEQRKKAEIELEHQEQRLRVTLDQLVDPVILIDDTANILSFNRAAEHVFGYSRQDVLGQNVRILMPEPHRTYHDDYIQSYLLTSKKKIIGQGREFIAQKANGQLFPVNLAVAEVRVNDQRLFSGIVRDITTQKETEKRIRKYTLELERSNTELNHFAYVASHDLKAPLRGIMQLTNWIEEDLGENLKPLAKEYIQLMQGRVSRLERLLDDLLAYSQLGRKHGDFHGVNVAALAQELFELMDPPSGFELICEKDLPCLITLSVPFEMILRNLINNALKHHDQQTGRIVVSALLHGDYFEFCVADDGPGIPPQHHDRIFGLFQTLKPRDQVEGSGMGLAMVKKVLERYHGQIEITPNGSRGTRFHFTWPDQKLLLEMIHGS